MVLSIYKWDQHWLRRAAYPNKYGLPGWALSPECCCACWFFVDDFDRSNSTHPGPNWNEVTGDWEILDLELHEKANGGGTSGAKLFGTTPVPAGSEGEMTLSIVVVDPQVNDCFYLYPCCRDTSTVGDVSVRYTYIGSETWDVEILSSGSGGLESARQLAAPIAPGRYTLWVCADRQTRMIRAGVISIGDPPAWEDNHDPGDGRYYALGHGNTTNGATFDDFYVTELRSALTTCTDCWCWCLYHALPKTLTATFTNATERAACIDGRSFELNWEWNAGLPRWRGSTTVTRQGVSVTLEFAIYCASGDDDVPSYPGKNVTLDFHNNMCCVANSNGCGTYLPVAADSTCQPLSLVFGPFVLATGDLTCRLCYDPLSGPPNGQYYLVITE